MSTSVLWFDKGSDPAARTAGFGETVGLFTYQASDKTGWATNEEAVVIKCAVPYTTGFFGGEDKAHMNEISSANKHSVSVITLLLQPWR